MKKIFTIITLIMFYTLPMANRAQGRVADDHSDYKGTVIVKNNNMAEIDGHLALSLDILIRNEAVQDYAAMRLVPKLVSKNNVKTFSDILIIGNNKRKTYQRWITTMGKRKRMAFSEPGLTINLRPHIDTLFSYDLRVPYEEWMDDATLIMEQETIGYRDEHNMSVFALNSKVKTAPGIPYAVKALVNYIEPAPEKKTRSKQGQAFLDFQVGKSQILPNYRRNEAELKKIKDALEEVSSNKDVHILGLFIEGYASPDGLYETNNRLARERAISLKNYIFDNFNIPIRSEQAQVSWLAEDWGGLRELVVDSDLKYKDEVVWIIDDISNISQRKLKIKSLDGGAVYNKLLKDIYPFLRRVEYQIDFTVRDFTYEETLSIMNKDYNLLSQLELFRAAQQLGAGNPGFDRIMLEIIPRMFPDDPVAQMNTAAAMIESGEYATARRYLEKFSDKPGVWNNLGVICMLENEFEKANAYFIKAQKAGIPEASHNIKELKLKEKDNMRLRR